ncbi:hypothetical protein ACH5RR_015821 [Cinchona calisaya]|uniref:Zinc transporter 10 n=1 Tax=Cinchona calisaya TaxID=153742 RepID=A0ABD2ZU79_9GENT
MATKLSKLISIFLILLAFSTAQVFSVSPGCEAESEDLCNNKSKALPLKIIAIVSILVTSMIGVCLPLVTRSIPALSPDRSLFVIVKAFAAGIILATGFMHVLPDSFDMLRSTCLKDNPWHRFPFTGFVAMLSAILTLMVDSMATSFYTKKNKPGIVIPQASVPAQGDQEMAVVNVNTGNLQCHHHESVMKDGIEVSQLLRYKVIAMVLELGIIVHSVVIGLSLGASNNTCTIKGLVAALCFHQMFEGMGLGGSISNAYQENSPRALITVGLLIASSSGLLIYMALVDLLASDFMDPKLQGSIKLQIESYMAVLLGAGGMSLLAKWA